MSNDGEDRNYWGAAGCLMVILSAVIVIGFVLTVGHWLGAW